MNLHTEASGTRSSEPAPFDVPPSSGGSLYWSVVLSNAAMFAVAALVLVVSPATVSSQVTRGELIVLLSGAVVIAAVNAVLLRGRLVPLDRLARTVDQVHTTDSGWRLPMPPGNGVERSFVAAINRLLDRLADERLAAEAQARAAEEGERQRIAHELHDEVGQRLTVVLMGTARLLSRASDEQREELLLMRDSTRESLQVIRGVADGLRGGLLEDVGLVGALASLLSSVERGPGSHQLVVQRCIQSSLPALPAEVERSVFRVAQEALTNVIRHADARTVWVELCTEPSGESVALVLTVADDGRGYRAASAGFGIAGMRERARSVGGEVAVRGRPEGGTEVRLTIPLQPGR